MKTESEGGSDGFALLSLEKTDSTNVSSPCSSWEADYITWRTVDPPHPHKNTRVHLYTSRNKSILCVCVLATRSAKSNWLEVSPNWAHFTEHWSLPSTGATRLSVNPKGVFICVWVTVHGDGCVDVWARICIKERQSETWWDWYWHAYESKGELWKIFNKHPETTADCVCVSVKHTVQNIVICIIDTSFSV